VPTYFVPVPVFPLTSNGKVDRKALPTLADVVREAQSSESYVAPQTETEEALAEIWATLLKVERVGVHDDFFNLGGHSLLVASLATEVQERWDMSLMLSVVFQNRTLESLAQVIDASVAGLDTDELDADELFNLP
jgi:acyl carrier protein